MELTQKDYDERKARVDAGAGDDEDARLVKHYEANGFTTEGNAPQPAGPGTDEPGERAGDAGPASTDDKGAARSRPSRAGK